MHKQEIITSWQKYYDSDNDKECKYLLLLIYQVNESKTFIGLEVESLPEFNLFTIDVINTLTE